MATNIFIEISADEYVFVTLGELDIQESGLSIRFKE